MLGLPEGDNYLGGSSKLTMAQNQFLCLQPKKHLICPLFLPRGAPTVTADLSQCEHLNLLFPHTLVIAIVCLINLVQTVRP